MTKSATNILSAIGTAFNEEFAKQQSPSPYFADFVKALQNCEGKLNEDTGKNAAELITMVQHMPNMLDQTVDNAVSRCLIPYIEHLDWYQIFDGDGIDKTFAQGLLAGQIVGKRGIVRAEDVFVGLFLLAPGVTYPLHQHPALEVYYVLSGSINIRHGRAKAPMNIQPGETSVTPPHQVHELQTGESPCLIAYIWTGDMKGENWWWEEQKTGLWDRICWERQANSSWAVTKREALSEAEIMRSGDH